MAGLLLCSSYFKPYQNREAYSPVNDGYIGQCKEKIHTLQVDSQRCWRHVWWDLRWKMLQLEKP